MTGQHCPGCRGSGCPGLPAPEPAVPGREPPLDMGGHATFLDTIALPGLCHCRIGKPHDVEKRAGYDQDHEQADRDGPARPRP